MKLAVFFPGIGYHCDKPLLYSSRKIVAEQGFEKIIALDYSHDGGNVKGNLEKMQMAFDDLYAQAEEKLKNINYDEYEEVLFVSKSVGTIIASSYANKHKIKCRHILYTPLEYTYDYPHDDAIGFIGMADTWSNVTNVIDKAKAEDSKIYTYEGLNHSLEGQDAIQNIEILIDVMTKTRDYVLKRL